MALASNGALSSAKNIGSAELTTRDHGVDTARRTQSRAGSNFGFQSRPELLCVWFAAVLANEPNPLGIGLASGHEVCLLDSRVTGHWFSMWISGCEETQVELRS